jgi:carboxypeptidase T
MLRRIFAPCCALLLLVVSAHAAEPANSSSFIVVKYQNREQLQALGSQFQHLIVDAKRREARVEANAEDIESLRAAGLDVQIDSVLTAKLQQFENSLRQSGSVKSIPGYSCYRTVEETYTTMSNLVATKPTLASIVDIGPSFEKSRNASLGYTMKVLRINNSATDATIADKPNMVIFGSIHAREYTPAELLTRFGEWLLNGYGTDPEATWLVDHNRFHLVLQANPDGRKKAETGLSWRKNTNNTNGSCSSSSFGTDLNRNFSFHWSTVAGGSSGDPCNETYRGPLRSSEPETKNLIQYVAGIADGSGVYQGGVLLDRRVDTASVAAPSDYKGMFIDIHSYSQLVLWPWGDTSTLAPNGPALRTLGRRLAWFNNYSPEQSSQLYATDGATDDNFYGSLGAPAYTIELGVAFFESCTTFQNTTLPNNLAALKYAARNLQSPYNLPTGPDTVSVTASVATVAAGTSFTVTATVNDSRFNQSNGTETVQNIASAAAYVDKLPWQSGATAIAMTAVDGTFNASSESVRATIPTTGLSAGQHRVYVQATDAAGKAGTPNAVLFTVTAGGNQAPVANFSFVSNGLSVNFSDGSTDSDGTIASRSWNFGDSTTSTATNPSKTYSAAGTYSVVLTVTDNGGATHSVTKSVTVSSAANVAPVANYSFTTSGLTATFTDSSTDSDGTIASRSWNFGDSSTSTATNPSKTYTAAGTYSVVLTVTDNGGATNSVTKSVTVTSTPPDTVLSNGVAKTGLSAATGASLNFTMVVPAGATGLKFVTAGGTGDSDMYVKFGSAPTDTVYDCRPYLGGNAETCNIATAQAGTYYVRLKSYAAFAGMSLTGSFSTVVAGPFFQNLTDYTIADNATVDSPITVSAVAGNAPATLSVSVNIVHTYKGDLKVDLVAPDGTLYNIHNRTGAGTDNIIKTVTINASSEVANGVWNLRVNDNASGDTGYINSWSMQF